MRETLPEHGDPDHRADLDLVEAVIQKRRRAIVEFVERMGCVPRMLAARNARLGNPLHPQDLPDLVQDTLVVVWRKLPEFEGRSSLETWIYRICCLELMNAVRRSRRPVHQAAGADEVIDATPDPRATAIPRDDDSHLHAAIDELHLDESEVIRMKHFQELTFAAIGERLGISVNTAKTRYYRGLRRLTILLGPRLGESLGRAGEGFLEDNAT